jgi:enoyl-CoA hydratase
MAARVEVTRDGHLLWITLDDARRHNAMGLGTVAAIHEALDGEAASEEARCVVITGAGGNFSSGADVHEFPDSKMGLWTFHNRFIEMYNRLRNYAIPVIAAIDGNCLGGGLELALSCDLRVATSAAVLGDPDIRLGTPGGTQRLIRALPDAVAKEMLFTGKRLSAEDALRFGVVNSVHDTADEMKEGAATLAHKVASMPPLAVGATKRLVNHGSVIPDLETATYFESEAVFRTSISEEHVEGVNAFLEKRAPQFPNDTTRFR